MKALWNPALKDPNFSRFSERFDVLAVFRADGSSKIGLGHLMRCLCLAEAMQSEGYDVLFVTKVTSSKIVDLIRQKGFAVEGLSGNASLEEDLNRMESILFTRKVDAVITDSYDLTVDYLDNLKKAGVFLVFIDDKGDAQLPAHLIINSNLGFSMSDYESLNSSRILLGPKYAIVRSEFHQAHVQTRLFDQPVKNVLITLGGSDVSEIMNKLIQWLQPFPFKITAVVGAGYPNTGSELKKNSNRVEVLSNVANMAELMLDADLGIIAGGTTCWETACTGLPVLVIEMAENQRRNAQEFQNRGVGLFCGQAKNLNQKLFIKNLNQLLTDPNLRKKMSQNGKALVDGQGAQRILAALKRNTYEKN